MTNAVRLSVSVTVANSSITWVVCKCSKCLRFSSDLSWSVVRHTVRVYDPCLLIVIDGGLMYVTKRRVVQC